MRAPTEELPPKSLAELRLIIASRKLVLPRQLEYILRGAMCKPELVAFGTARSIARACSVSPTTVVRLSRFLGFASFHEFRRLFREHLKERIARNRDTRERYVGGDVPCVAALDRRAD